MAEIIILGAGLTGLSAAYHLEAQGFFDYKIFEKDSSVGGLCRSVQQDGFTFDYTGHLLHINDDYFRNLIQKLIGFEQFNTIKRQSFIYSQNRYTRYPYQVNLYGLPPKTIIECIEGFINRPTTPKKIVSFHDWVMQSFGEGLAKHFFFPYQTKIFDYDVKKLTASWTGRFVPSTSLESLLQGALMDNYSDDIGYNSHFFYPKKGGIFNWLSKIHQNLLNTVQLNCAAKQIDLHNKKIVFENGSEEPFIHLINTVPLNDFLKLVKERPDTRFQWAIDKLLCNSVVNFNLGIARENLSNRHWIYFPEHEYPFYRIGFPHNFSANMAPPACSSLYGEFSFLDSSQAKIYQQLHASLKKTKALFNLEEAEIVTEKIITIDHAYVIFNNWRDKNLPSLLLKLQDMNVRSIGRYGAWKYSSMQEGILDGKHCAEEILLRYGTLSPSLPEVSLNL